MLTVLLCGLIPDLDCPVWAAGDENTWVEVVPLDGVHRHVVSIKGLQQLVGVGFGALEPKQRHYKDDVTWAVLLFQGRFLEGDGLSAHNCGSGNKQRSRSEMVYPDRQQIGLITGNSCLVALYFLFVIRFTQVSEVSDAGYNSMTCGNSCCTDRLIVDLWLGEDSQHVLSWGSCTAEPRGDRQNTLRLIYWPSVWLHVSSKGRRLSRTATEVCVTYATPQRARLACCFVSDPELSQSKPGEQFNFLSIFLKGSLGESSLEGRSYARFLAMCDAHTLCIFPSSVPTRKRWSICLWKSNEVPETTGRSIRQIRNILMIWAADLIADM